MIDKTRNEVQSSFFESLSRLWYDYSDYAYDYYFISSGYYPVCSVCEDWKMEGYNLVIPHISCCYVAMVRHYFFNNKALLEVDCYKNWCFHYQRSSFRIRITIIAGINLVQAFGEMISLHFYSIQKLTFYSVWSTILDSIVLACLSAILSKRFS